MPTIFNPIKKFRVIKEVEKGIKQKCEIGKEYGILPNLLLNNLKKKENYAKLEPGR